MSLLVALMFVAFAGQTGEGRIKSDEWAAIDELKANVLIEHSKREAITVRYKMMTSGMDKYSGLESPYIKRLISVDRSGEYLYFDNSHGHSSMDFRNDPFRKITLIEDGSATILSTLNAIVMNEPVDSPRLRMSQFPPELNMLVGWWPLEGVPEPKIMGKERSIERILDHAVAKYAHWSEDVNGVECEVLELPGEDTIWIDKNNGYLIRKREMRSLGNADSFIRYEFSDFRPVGDNIAFPFLVKTVESFGSNQSKMVQSSSIEVVDVKINDDSASTNRKIIYPCGAIQVTQSGEVKLINDNEYEFAKSILNWSRAYFVAAPKSINSGLLRFAIFILGCVVSAVSLNKISSG